MKRQRPLGPASPQATYQRAIIELSVAKRQMYAIRFALQQGWVAPADVDQRYDMLCWWIRRANRSLHTARQLDKHFNTYGGRP